MVALLGYGFFTFIYLVLIAGSFATGRLDALPLFAAAAIVGTATMVATARQSRFANWLAGAFVVFNLIALLAYCNAMNEMFTDPSR